MENNKKHILIVDDDNRIRDLLKDFLTTNNYIVSTAENADQAKNKLEYLKFDIIILDVMMPGQSGFELTKEIKENQSSQQCRGHAIQQLPPPGTYKWEAGTLVLAN